MPRGAASLEQRFWSKVDRRSDSECWPWLGYRNPKGYGRFTAAGRGVPAARIAWCLASGTDFPAGLLACHRCDNPPCCNPAHIWPGTHAENQRDMALKGRWGKRAAHGAYVPRGRSDTPLGFCPNGHRRSDENTRIIGGHLCCRECSRATSRRFRIARGAKPVDPKYGHGKLCIRCGHHRTDDYRERNGFKCRACNLARTHARRGK
jgi:hypothetical protein